MRGCQQMFSIALVLNHSSLFLALGMVTEKQSIVRKA